MMIEGEDGRLPPALAGDSNDRRPAATRPAPAAMVAVPDGPSRRGSDCQKHPIALIDESALRRASALNLLRAYMREGARPFRDAAEFLAQLHGHAGAPSGIVLSVGARSLMKEPLREQLRALRRALPSTPVIVLSDLDEPEEARAAFREGARGYILTSLEPLLVIEAIRMVLAGGTFVPVEMIVRSRCKTLAAAPQQSPPEYTPAEQQVAADHRGEWPRRQLAVLHLLAEGRANKEIARALAMEESTVKVHVRHIMRKLGALNRTQAALCARRLGITAPPRAATGAGAPGPTPAPDASFPA
jgi:DNA-binding NarL/FixJ family response regulator